MAGLELKVILSMPELLFHSLKRHKFVFLIRDLIGFSDGDNWFYDRDFNSLSQISGSSISSGVMIGKVAKQQIA